MRIRNTVSIVAACLALICTSARADMELMIKSYDQMGDRANFWSDPTAPIHIVYDEVLTLSNDDISVQVTINLVEGDELRDILDKINAFMAETRIFARPSTHGHGFGVELIATAFAYHGDLTITSTHEEFDGSQSGFDSDGLDTDNGWGYSGYFQWCYLDGDLQRMDHFVEDGGVNWFANRQGAPHEWNFTEQWGTDLYLIPEGTEVGSTWPSRWLEGDLETVATRMADDTITVPAGTFETVVVQYEPVSGPPFTRRIWFAADVGPVKVELQGGVQELTSYDVSAGGEGLYPLAVGNWWHFGDQPGAPAPRRLPVSQVSVDADGAGRGNTIHVPADWPTIASGLAAAAFGDTVLVAAGTYHEFDLELKGGVTLRSETGQADCVTIDAQGWSRVLLASSTLGYCRLEGFTVTGGDQVFCGGGLLLYETTIEVTNCRFTGNTGSAIYLSNGPWFSSDMDFTSCLFEGNTGLAFGESFIGGGFYSNDAGPTLIECRFLDNSPTGVSCVNSSHPRFMSCTFRNEFGLEVRYARPDLIHCVISHNPGDGLIMVKGSYVDLDYCEIAFNGGAGIRCLESSFRFEHVTIHGNTENGIWTDGMEESSVRLYSTLITGTEVGDGFRIESAPYYGQIYLCDIWGNAGGDWTEPYLAPFITDYNYNYNEDPKYCDPEAGDLTVEASSICLVYGIGAYGQGCDWTAVPEGAIPIFALAQNHPNPFNPSTEISFSLAEAEEVFLDIFDISGRLVRNLVAGTEYPAGNASVSWSGLDERDRPLASGVYFYRLRAGAYTETRKMTLLR